MSSATTSGQRTRRTPRPKARRRLHDPAPRSNDARGNTRPNPRRADAATLKFLGPAPELQTAKYFASGWWNTIAETLASGSIMKPSVSSTPIDFASRSWKRGPCISRSGQAG